jgi:large subunit ribosomal protein L5e
VQGFVKVVKNKAYFKRFQTQFRRRREGKTDYYQRTRLVVQAKNKYDQPKHRLVVRFSNKYVLVQIVRALMNHDDVISQASSRELGRYGLSVGLKNYAAAYCTGLLAARRVLSKLGLASLYTGAEELNGEIYQPEEAEERRPFKCILDVGLKATTTGSRIFGALKGASDGGLWIPQSHKRFPGYDKESKSLDADVHRNLIVGGHVASYMNSLKEEDPETYGRLFSKYIAAGIDGDNLEEVYEKVHEAIRADPSPAPKKTLSADAIAASKKYRKPSRRNLKDRRNRILQKKQWRLSVINAAQAGGDDEDDE